MTSQAERSDRGSPLRRGSAGRTGGSTRTASARSTRAGRSTAETTPSMTPLAARFSAVCTSAGKGRPFSAS